MLVLVGESGSGKSTIEKFLQKKGMNKIISYTTREPREGEVDGVDYHFNSSPFFHSDCRLAESVEYNGNLYGILVEDCKDDRVVVVEPNGLRQLKKREDINIISFYIEVPEEERAIRMLERGDKIDYVYKRITNDREVFKNTASEVDFVIGNDCLNETIRVIKKLYEGGIYEKRGVK